MTVLPAGGFRGHFDPVSLGLHAPAYFDQMKLENEDSTADWSVFVHELTHYMQFYGSALGIGYVHAIYGRVEFLERIVSRMVERGVRSCPVSQAGVDLRFCVDTDKELETFSSYMFAWRYFQEEIYGWTFPEFSYMPIWEGPERPLITSTFHVANGRSAYPLLGESLLEGHAACNQAMFLHWRSPSTEIADRLINKYFVALKGPDCARYNAISVYLDFVQLSHIKELIFFILLNQPIDGFFGRLGEYTLIRNLRRVFRAFDHIGKLKKPKDEHELSAAIETICDKASLENPFTTLDDLRGLLEDDDRARGEVSSINWIARRAITWQLENKFHALYWPVGPMSIISSVPLIKLWFRKSTHPKLREEGYLNIPNFRPEDIGESSDKEARRWLAVALQNHLHYTTRSYIITGLFERARTRCPFYISTKPSISNSCAACSGFFPDKNIRSDCVVADICHRIGLKLDLLSAC